MPASVAHQTDYIEHAWTSSHFTTVAQHLPKLLEAAQRAALAAPPTEQVDAYRALIGAYRLASSMLLKFESHDVAWLAADRAMHTALAVDDTRSQARATRSVARAMSAARQRTEAVETLLSMSDRMRPEVPKQPTILLSLHGMLHLAAAINAAEQEDASLALSMHQEATHAAERMERHYDTHHTHFGRANVAIHRVAALVRLYEAEAALNFAATIPSGALDELPPERRANHLLDLTEANARCGNFAEATRALAQAERIAPQEVRSRPLAHGLLRMLLSNTTGEPTRMVKQMAERAGVTERVLYLMICGAGPASHVDVGIKLAQDAGWSVYCIATPAAVEHFLDLDELHQLTGHPVRTGYQGQSQPSLPPADAVIVAPATYNTINKWAAGIADTYVLTQLAELTGLGVPIAVLPFVNTALANNVVLHRSFEVLRGSGVRVLFGSSTFEPHPPRQGERALVNYPWKKAVEAVGRQLS